MYVALYRKYRPQKFKDIVGQKYITTTLKNEIKLKKIVHAYIFTGPKGTGKTTSAKVFSKAINCLNEENGEPCCECEICIGLKRGSILDITEIDGASNNSVNDIRILREEANFSTTHCRYRVYIIDEVHMLSSSAFSALLKIMEEPPDNVVFILATTEISKVPKTICSRCQIFNFKRINPTEIKTKIVEIAKKEKIEISEKAALKIALLSTGSMRDALSIFDRCSIGNSKITESILEENLGIIKKENILNLHKAIKNENELEILKTIEELYYSGKNLEDLLQELLNFYREMLYSIMLEEKTKDFLEYYEYLEEIEKVKCFDFEKTNLILENILECYEKVKNSSNQKLILEIEILKIAKLLNNKKNNETKKNENYEIKLKEKINIKEKDIENIKPLEPKENRISNKKKPLEKLIELAKENKIPFEEI